MGKYDIMICNKIYIYIAYICICTCIYMYIFDLPVSGTELPKPLDFCDGSIKGVFCCANEVIYRRHLRWGLDNRRTNK